MFADDDEEDLHLVVHVLQPLQSQVGDDTWRAIVNRQNIDLELLWSSRHYLENQTSWRRKYDFEDGEDAFESTVTKNMI